MATPHVAGIGAYLLGLSGNVGPGALTGQIVSLGTPNTLSGIPAGTTNLLAYNGAQG
jgi:cerevisin